MNIRVLHGSRSNPGFDRSFFSFLLRRLHIYNYSSFVLYLSEDFYSRMNKPNIHTDIIGISSFRDVLTHPLSAIGFYFKSKIVEGSHKNNVF